MMKRHTRGDDTTEGVGTTSNTNTNATITIRDVADPTMERLTLGPRRHTSPRTWHHDLRTVTDRRHVVTLTPWMCLACQPRRITRPTSTAHLLLCDMWRETRDSGQQAWLRYLGYVRRALCQWVRRRSAREEGGTTWHWHDSVHRVHDCTTWQVMCQDMARLSVYDASCGASSSEALQAHTYVRFVVQLENVWFNAVSQRFGVHIRILQAQHASLEPPTMCFFSAVAAAPPPASSAPCETTRGEEGVCMHKALPQPQQQPDRKADLVYGKYFRMLEVGIPRPCVEQKMRMLSLDPCVLDTPPQEPLPATTSSTTGGGGGAVVHGRDGLSIELLAAQTLRKVTVNDRSTADGARAAAPASRRNGHGLSLQVIRERLASLRRVARRRKRNTGSGHSVADEDRGAVTTTARLCGDDDDDGNDDGDDGQAKKQMMLSLLESKFAHRKASSSSSSS